MLEREDAPMHDWPAHWAMAHAMQFEMLAHDGEYRASFRRRLSPWAVALLKRAMPPELFAEVMAAGDSYDAMRRTGERLEEWARQRLERRLR
jgi:hypothetical protein